MPHVYLIQTRESLRIKDHVYKIGCTTRPFTVRFKEYPKGSEIICCHKVENCQKVEKKIIEVFDERFVQKPMYGREYYSGDVNMMELTIIEIVAAEKHAKMALGLKEDNLSEEKTKMFDNQPDNPSNDSSETSTDKSDIIEDDWFVGYLRKSDLDWYYPGNTIHYTKLYNEYKEQGGEFGKSMFSKTYQNSLYEKGKRVRIGNDKKVIEIMLL